MRCIGKKVVARMAAKINFFCIAFFSSKDALNRRTFKNLRILALVELLGSLESDTYAYI
jgi:hypothetical protein